MSKLRFAPLVRVSTEAQAMRGESLKTQEDQISKYVEQLGGEVLNWDYSGQEHATPDQERLKLDKLLKDAQKKLFDAVIVCDLSRWSRDNRRSKDGLEILKAAGIRFFVGPSEYNLHSPEQCLFVGMATEMNEFFAMNQSLKSIQNRINRAKRGIPTSGKLPYGRTWSKKEGWGLDQEKQRIIQFAAERYLSGESMEKIAQTLGVNHSNLWKIMTKRAGDKWEIRFRNIKLNIDEPPVALKIPPLLSKEMISAIKNKGAANKTYTHGQLKHEYLLGRVVFCAECGNAMFGQTNHGERRYYRHPRGRNKKCNPGLWVPAQQLEDAVMVSLFDMFGDIERLEKAVKKATPDATQLNKLYGRLAALVKELEGIKRQKDNVVQAIADGIFANEEARSKMEKLRERESLLADEKARIESELGALPDYRKKLSGLKKAVMSAGLFVYYLPERLGEMDYQAKRKVVQAAFAGKDRKGRLGVYVWKKDDAWQYDIRGIVPIENFENSSCTPILQGELPMDKDEAQFILNVDTDYSDFNPLTQGERHVTKFALS